MATIEKSFDSGLHTEQLSGRTQEIFFSAEEDENFVYPYNAFDFVLCFENLNLDI